MNSPEACIEAYRNRDVSFAFRGRPYLFSLSPELFSSANIDTGSRFLLKVFSAFLDKVPGGFLTGGAPYSVLDAGSGTGVLGICAAGALKELSGGGVSPPAFYVRAQDRDELARLFTEHNARRNGIGAAELSAHAEPLLAGPPGQRWNLILTNIPAKTGLPVLEDFVRRSAGLLEKDGRVFLVAVNTLADFFRSQIVMADIPLLAEEAGKEHTVFVYAKQSARNIEQVNEINQTPRGPALPGEKEADAPVIFDENFPRLYPFYIRNRGEYETEKIFYRLDTVYGAPGFDEPGGAVEAAVKLAVKINLAEKLAAGPAGKESAAMLIHDSGQGHFALWLAHYLKGAARRCRWVLSGRNILALAAARHGLVRDARVSADSSELHDNSRPLPLIVPTADILPDAKRFGPSGKSPEAFAFAAFFPATVPDARAAWESLARLTLPSGIIISGMTSADSERFDRAKPQGFTRLGDIKRKGFRALAYKNNLLA